MVELLGILLAALVLLVAWQAIRALRWAARRLRTCVAIAAALLRPRPRRARPAGPRPVRARIAALRGLPLRAGRALRRRQAARIAELTLELDRTRRALRLAEAARAAPPAPEERFKRAKRAFAVLFHPDKLRCQEPERSVRANVFQQYWQVLRQIERG